MSECCEYWSTVYGYRCFNVRYGLAADHMYPQSVSDVMLAVSFIAANARSYGVDPERIVLAGVSAGGHLALMAALADQGRYLPGDSAPVILKGVISLAGPTNLAVLARHDDRAWRMVRGFMGGTAKQMPGRYRDASPISHVSADDPNVMLVHARGDRTIPFSQSAELKQALGAEDVPCALLETPGGGRNMHGHDPCAEPLASSIRAFLKSIDCAVNRR